MKACMMCAYYQDMRSCLQVVAQCILVVAEALQDLGQLPRLGPKQEMW
jgi:hypothetical protein